MVSTTVDNRGNIRRSGYQSERHSVFKAVGKWKNTIGGAKADADGYHVR